MRPIHRELLLLGAAVACCLFAGAVVYSPHRVSGVAYAHDGDTMTVAGTSIRLRGIDAEELSEPHGHDALVQLRTLVAGREITCILRGKSYKRRVGSCYMPDGSDVGALMVQTGHALDCSHYSGGRYRSLEPAGIRAVLIAKPYC